jgi:hypothetical protein
VKRLFSGQAVDTPLLAISLQKEVRLSHRCSQTPLACPHHALQALLDYISQLGVSYFRFVWDDNVIISAAAHMLTPAADTSGDSALPFSLDSCSCIQTPSQRIPWSPHSLKLPLQRGNTYLCPALSPAQRYTSALPVQPI